MDFYDILVSILYLFLVYALAFLVRSYYTENVFYRRFFIPGLTAKIIGGLAFAMVYTYYYTYGGDSMAYYEDATSITNYFFHDAINALSVLWNPENVSAPEAQELVRQFRLEHKGTEFPVVRAASILNILGMNSYFSTTILFASCSFFGVWHFFLVFAKRYPHIAKQLAIAVLFIPSVFFWGSGIMKDSMVIGFLGVMLYSIDRFLEAGVKRFFWAMVILLCGQIIFSVKAYVVIALAPAIVIWVVLSVKDRIKNKFVRGIIVPVLMVISVLGMALSIEFLGRYQERYSLENFFNSAYSMQTWHYQEGENTSDNHGRGSSYTLGDYEPTILGTLKKFPAAVNATFFRPYFWEVKNVAMLASAIESFVMLLFTLFIFIGLGFFRVLKLLLKDPFLLMSFSFAIFFAFAVGFTSYNFGALGRYKIPCIPFFVASLLILNHKVKEIKMQRKLRAIALARGDSFQNTRNREALALKQRPSVY